MSEFCAGVKILLERMKSNPEDFELLDHDMRTLQSVKGRFYDFANSMEAMLLNRDNKDRTWGDWQYFTEEERQALIDGFKGMKRAKFDKGIMEQVFDERYIERQREEMQMQYQAQIQRQQMRQAAQQQNMAAQQARNFATNNTGGGFDLGLGGIFR